MSEPQKVQNIKKLPIEPCGAYILVKPDKFERKTASGLIVATEAEAEREDVARVEGILVAVGPAAWADYIDGEPWAEVGDHIYFKRHIADRYVDKDDLDENGKPQIYFLMNDLNLLARINDER